MRRAVVDSILFKAGQLGKEVNVNSDSLLLIPTIRFVGDVSTNTTINIEEGSKLESIVAVNKHTGTSTFSISFSDGDPPDMPFDVSEINEFVVNKSKKTSFSITVTVNSGKIDVYVIYLKGIYK